MEEQSNYLIDVADKDELAKWCRLLNCEEKDLIQAISIIGPVAARVNDYLELNRKKINS